MDSLGYGSAIVHDNYGILCSTVDSLLTRLNVLARKMGSQLPFFVHHMYSLIALVLLYLQIKKILNFYKVSARVILPWRMVSLAREVVKETINNIINLISHLTIIIKLNHNRFLYLYYNCAHDSCQLKGINT